MESQDRPVPTGKNSKGNYVCISYRSTDSDIVFNDCVFPIMKDFGLRVYWDEDFRNNAAKAWNSQMLDNIEGSEAVILFVSNSYIESYACFLEALFSYVYGKKVIMIKLDWNLKQSDNTEEKNISESTIEEFRILQKEFTADVQERLPKGFYRFISNLISNKRVSPREISIRFMDLLGKFEITQLDINDVSKSLTSLVNSIQNINKDVFEPVISRQKSEAKPKEEPRSKPVKNSRNVEEIPELNISSDATIGEIRHVFSDPDTVKQFRQVRESMPWGGKSYMDYVMAAILAGCNNVKEDSPKYQINYYLYAVASESSKDKSLGATWTWSSNCRKALGLEKSGQIPDSYNSYFKDMPEDTNLETLGKMFAEEESEAFKTVKKTPIIIALNSLSAFLNYQRIKGTEKEML